VFTLSLWLCLYLIVFSQQSGDLRIVGDPDRHIGRLEVYFRGQWGTICIEGFTEESANTACRQLGRVKALTFIEANRIGYVSLTICSYVQSSTVMLIWAFVL